jgi:hypothetical protein
MQLHESIVQHMLVNQGYRYEPLAINLVGFIFDPGYRDRPDNRMPS